MSIFIKLKEPPNEEAICLEDMNQWGDDTIDEISKQFTQGEDIEYYDGTKQVLIPRNNIAYIAKYG